MIPFAHRFPAEALEENPLWLVVLADMMTNLMLFFLVMFATTLQGQKAKEALAHALDETATAATAADPKAERAVREFQEQEAARALREAFGDVKADADAIRLSLRDKLIFETAEDRLTLDAAQTLAGLARVLAPLPNTVVVEGHTDNVRVVSGPFRSNWELSVARANSVIVVLARMGLEPSRLVAAGYGEHLPAAPNADAQGRARNRRVEIVILRHTPPDTQ